MIYIIGGVHCDKKLYKHIIKVLEKADADLVCFEELTNNRDTIKACKDLIEEKIDLEEFKERTKFEKYWFDFEPYEEFLCT